MRIARSVLSMSAAAVIGAALSTAPVHAQTTCDWYAKTALEQQKLNIDRRCGLKGLSWSSDRQAHMSWCATTAPDEWKRQAQLREQALAKCVAGNK